MGLWPPLSAAVLLFVLVPQVTAAGHGAGHDHPMTGDEDYPSAEVYAVLLYQPEWYGVPVKIVLWNMGLMMIVLTLCLALLPGLMLRLVAFVVIVVGALVVHVGLRSSRHTDPDFFEIVLRFVLLVSTLPGASLMFVRQFLETRRSPSPRELLASRLPWGAFVDD